MIFDEFRARIKFVYNDFYKIRHVKKFILKLGREARLQKDARQRVNQVLTGTLSSRYQSSRDLLHSHFLQKVEPLHMLENKNGTFTCIHSKVQRFTWKMVTNLIQIGTCSLARVIEHWRHTIASPPEFKNWA